MRVEKMYLSISMCTEDIICVDNVYAIWMCVEHVFVNMTLYVC